MRSQGSIDIWRHPNTGELTRSCAIVTTSPSPSLEPDPQPHAGHIEFLRPKSLWLDPLTQDPEPLGSLIQSYPDEELEHLPSRKNGQQGAGARSEPD